MLRAIIYILYIYTVSFSFTVADTINKNGENIYLTGTGENGQPVNATSAANTRLDGDKAACVNCHRRSGFGSSEGGLLIPSITGKSLFNSREFKYKELKRKSNRPITRKPYNKTSLKNAIKHGIDANGRTLSPLMPRYNMDDNNIDDLVLYLSELGVKPAPGVNSEIINFATIITPEVPEKRKTAMLAVLNTYIKAKNSESRLEKRRATNSPWHKKWSYTAYRKWNFEVWQLTGKADSWPSQLAEFYKRKPVFAIVSGISSVSWQPMHDFCNSYEIPCLFPNTKLSGKLKTEKKSNKDSYTIYFSEGIALEAKVIAKHIFNTRTNEYCNNIIQIIDGSEKTKFAAQVLINQLLSYKFNTKTSIIEKNSNQFNKLKNNESRNDRTVDCLVHWIDNSILNNNQLNKSHNIKKNYIASNAKTSSELTSLTSNTSTYYVTPFALEKSKKRHLKRIMIWAKANDISPIVEEVTANTYFAVTVMAKGIKHIRSHFSRDYLVERLEHMVDNTVFHSVYKSLSLGPSQRFASKGAYIIGPIKKSKNINDTNNSEWIIP